LISLGRLEDAEIPLASIAAVAADQCMFWAATGLLDMRRRQYGDALVAIKRAIELDHGDPSGWESMAALLLALEDYTKALEVAIHGLELRPFCPDLLELKAKALRGLGRDGEAEEIEGAVEARLAEQLALLDQMEGTSE
jgi:tetratricopeptide (TPR) repeat protein